MTYEVLLVTTALGLVLGLLTGRWWAVALAAIGWPVFSAILWSGDEAGLWAAGRSEDDEESLYVTVLVTYVLAAMAGAAAGVVARKLVGRGQPATR